MTFPCLWRQVRIPTLFTRITATGSYRISTYFPEYYIYSFYHYSGLFTIFSNVITNIGIKIICTIIPGTALMTAPAKNALRPNFETSSPMQQNITTPQTNLPMTIALNKDTYTFTFFFGSLLCNQPAIKPYEANSKAIQNAVGNIGGIPKANERNNGAINPTASPQGAPQKNPHNNTGICIGHNIEPTCGICPVKNGITNARAKNIADNTSFLISLLLILQVLSAIKKGVLRPLLSKSNTFWYRFPFIFIIC